MLCSLAKIGAHLHGWVNDEEPKFSETNTHSDILIARLFPNGAMSCGRRGIIARSLTCKAAYFREHSFRTCGY